MEDDRPPRHDACQADEAVQAAHRPRAPVAAGGHRDRPRAAVPRRPGGQPGHREGRHAHARDRRDRVPRGRDPQLARRLRADLLHRLDGRADPGRPAQPPLPPPAAALARLLRAEPGRRDHQPPDERRGGDRPARHRRRDDTRAEHADALRHCGDPLHPRLAARARDAGRPPVPVRRDGDLPNPRDARLQRGACEAGNGDCDPRRGHRGHARRAVLQPRASSRSASSSA